MTTFTHHQYPEGCPLVELKPRGYFGRFLNPIVRCIGVLEDVSFEAQRLPPSPACKVLVWHSTGAPSRGSTSAPRVRADQFHNCFWFEICVGVAHGEVFLCAGSQFFSGQHLPIRERKRVIIRGPKSHHRPFRKREIRAQILL